MTTQDHDRYAVFADGELISRHRSQAAAEKRAKGLKKHHSRLRVYDQYAGLISWKYDKSTGEQK